MGNVYVALLWHHHQPYYREGPEGRYAMPWVRLHAIKDYYGMAWLAQQHPQVHLTFNLVPSLLAQLDDYARGTARETRLELTAKPAQDLTEKDVHTLLDECFSANWDRMIRPRPGYHELLRKRRFGRRTAAQAAEDFSTQDLLDLQVWSTLAWFFPQLLRDDPVLRDLVAKDHGFTEEDKAAMMAREREVIARVLPMYRELQESGSAELSVSPFYHPILPLLCRMDRAREALPHLPMPRHVADFTEDARVQVARAVEAYQASFGRAPRGLWPSEGSVSPEVPPLAAAAGFRWIATDEGILCRSLGRTLCRDGRGRLQEPDTLYQAYRAPADSGELAIIFRDRVLSDLIGFQYYNQPPGDAAADLVGRLSEIAAGSGARDAFVAIILDGENAWEHYEDSGIPFLHALYDLLARTPHIHTVTVSEHLESHPPQAVLPRLFSGSWINSDFGIWIGHQEDRRGWELLAQTRQFLAARTDGARPLSPELSKAWEELYVAEGSDWFWWYGDDHSSPQDAEFDRLFRLHLQNVYRLVGESPPEVLDEPIARAAIRVPYSQPTAFLQPEIDGRQGTFFEWTAAGIYRRELDPAGAMEKATPDRIHRVYFGFSESEFFLRIDCQGPFIEQMPAAGRILVVFTEPRHIHLEVSDLQSPHPRLRIDGRECRGGRAAAGPLFELACPFQELGFRPREACRFHLRLTEGEAVVERAPRVGAMTFDVPTRDFEYEMWQV